MHSGEVAGALGQRKGRREEERENPKDPEGREGREARDGNRGYLRHCPGAAVGLALAALALEPAAPPGALGHPGMALAGAPRLAASTSTQPWRGGSGPAARGRGPLAGRWRAREGVMSPGQAGPGAGEVLRGGRAWEAQGLAAGWVAAWRPGRWVGALDCQRLRFG